MSPAVVNRAVLRSDVPRDELEKEFKFSAWAHGTRPTINQLTKFANRVGVPFGYILLEEQPAVALPVPDFR